MSVNDAREYHTAQSHYLREPIDFNDNGSVVSLGWVPAKATIIGGGVVVSTAFNGDTTNAVDIGFRNAADGTTADPDDYATALALGTVGIIVADALATATGYHSEGAEITASVTSTASASAGAGYVWVEYLVDTDED